LIRQINSKASDDGLPWPNIGRLKIKRRDTLVRQRIPQGHGIGLKFFRQRPHFVISILRFAISPDVSAKFRFTDCYAGEIIIIEG
jgi:hypothetical protein